MENQVHKQPWLHSWAIDGIFILSPPFIALLLVICFPETFQSSSGIPIYYWLFLVVFIDVAHVYSTLYRTYFINGSYKKEAYLIYVPITCYIVGVLLHIYDGMLFWRVLAYLAIFHFIRQQYGFMRLYSRQEAGKYWYRLTDKVTVYAATIYPLFYWHFAGDRNFSWFVEDDILLYKAPLLLNICTFIYLTIIIVYIIKEIVFIIKTRVFNFPRNLLIGGTLLSWYFGIVYFNGDLAFTTLNVISHGIPYMALIWIFEKNKQVKDSAAGNLIFKYTFGKYGGVVLFILLLAVLAYIEEGLWDGMVWKEHGRVFGMFSGLPKIIDEQVLSLLVPLLALPQAAHYILDGFIWRLRKEKH